MSVPIFIFGSGRCGTQLIAQKLFSLYPEVEAHHEYNCVNVQALGALAVWFNPYKGTDEALRRVYGSALHYTNRRFWCDCSNKLTWLLDPLVELFPDARFIHLVRDGRKVASSFYNKLGSECYTQRGVRRLITWLKFKNTNMPAPPLEKENWWPVEDTDLFRSMSMDKDREQFSRICRHWAWSNEEAVRFGRDHEVHWVRLEDLVADKSVLRLMLEFIGLPYREGAFEIIQRPHNVTVPLDYGLTEVQDGIFWSYGADMMREFGYERDDYYEVDYGG